MLDVRFIPLGKTYLPELGRVYAAAWNEGARALESGQPVAAALKSVDQSWDSGRVQLFDRLESVPKALCCGPSPWSLVPKPIPVLRPGQPTEHQLNHADQDLRLAGIS